EDLAGAGIDGDYRTFGHVLRGQPDAQAVLVDVVERAGQHVLGQALELRVEGQHDVVTRLRGPQHVRRDLGAAVVDLDPPRSRVPEQRRLVRGLYPGDADEVVDGVTGVVYGIGLLGIADDLGRQVRRVGALDPLP